MSQLYAREYNTENLRHFNSETAREAAEKSAEARRKKKDLTAYFRRRLDSKLDIIMNKLEEKALEGDLKTIKFFLDQAGYTQKQKRKISVFEEMNDIFRSADYLDKDTTQDNGVFPEFQNQVNSDDYSSSPSQKEKISSLEDAAHEQTVSYVLPSVKYTLSAPIHPYDTPQENFSEFAYSIPLPITNLEQSENYCPDSINIVPTSPFVPLNNMTYEPLYSVAPEICSASATKYAQKQSVFLHSTPFQCLQTPTLSTETILSPSANCFTLTPQKIACRLRLKQERVNLPSSLSNSSPSSTYLKFFSRNRLLSRNCTRTPIAMRKTIATAKYPLLVIERPLGHAHNMSGSDQADSLQNILYKEYFLWNPPPPMDFRRIPRDYTNPNTGERLLLYEDEIPRRKMKDMGIPWPEESIPPIVFDPTPKSPSSKIFPLNANSSRFFHAERENRPFFKTVYWENIEDPNYLTQEENIAEEDYENEDDDMTDNQNNTVSQQSDPFSFLCNSPAKPSVIDRFVAFLLSPVKKDSSLTWEDDLIRRFAYLAQQGDISPLLKFARLMKTVDSMKRSMNMAQIKMLLNLYEKLQ